MVIVAKRAIGRRHQSRRIVRARFAGIENARHTISYCDFVRRHGWRKGSSLFRLYAFCVSVASGEPGLYLAGFERSFRAAQNLRKLSFHGDRPALRRRRHRICEKTGGNATALRLYRRRNPARAASPNRRRFTTFARRYGATIFHPAGTCRMDRTPKPSSTIACKCAALKSFGLPTVPSCPRSRLGTPTFRQS